MASDRNKIVIKPKNTYKLHDENTINSQAMYKFLSTKITNKQYSPQLGNCGRFKRKRKINEKPSLFDV